MTDGYPLLASVGFMPAGLGLTATEGPRDTLLFLPPPGAEGKEKALRGEPLVAA